MLATEDRRDATGVLAGQNGAATDGWADAPLDPQRRVASRRRNPLLAMATGLVVMAMALANLVARTGSPSDTAGAGTRPSAPAAAGVVIAGSADVQAQLATYAPGQSSGWHAHTGLHAVIVLSGTLTIVDAGCHHRTFSPGESYVGGREVHLAINETTSPVEMAITYMFPAGVSHTEFHVAAPPPPDCEAG